MIKASEIREQVEEVKKSYEEVKKAEELKKKNDKINSEMLEVEKVLNEFRRNIATKGVKAIKPYIEVPISISNDVCDILREQGYYIPYASFGEKTHLYYDKTDFINNTRGVTTSGMDLGRNQKDDERTITKDGDDMESILKNIFPNAQVYRF